MKKRMIINKSLGETPLEALERFRAAHPELKTLPLTYAGRLDPMATGKLLILIGDECRRKDEYLKLDKVYEFSVLFGFSTDSYDLLGLVRKIKKGRTKITKPALRKVLKNLKGEQRLPYPPYSSKTISGTPLWKLARRGCLTVRDIPKRIMNIYSISCLSERTIPSKKLLNSINSRMHKVKGDFRQGEIMARWRNILVAQDKSELQIARFKVTCSSGTYVRSLVNQISRQLKCPAVTFSIRRIKIG